MNVILLSLLFLHFISLLILPLLLLLIPFICSVPRYATFETLFDTIKQEHDIAQRHTGRLLTHKALALKFCNITMEHVIAFIDLCLTCAMKKGRAKKGVVVKPLVSSSMGSRAQVNHTVWIEKTKKYIYSG